MALLRRTVKGDRKDRPVAVIYVTELMITGRVPADIRRHMHPLLGRRMTQRSKGVSTAPCQHACPAVEPGSSTEAEGAGLT